MTKKKSRKYSARTAEVELELADEIFIHRHHKAKELDYTTRIFKACSEACTITSTNFNLSNNGTLSKKIIKKLKEIAIKNNVEFKRLKMIFNAESKQK